MSQVICLGEILIECFAEPAKPLSSELPSELSAGEMARWMPLPGGSLANVACGLAKLGQQVEFIGAVGHDHWGDALTQLLVDIGVGHRGLQYRQKAPTRQVYITTDEHGDRTFAGFSENDAALFADAHLFASALNPEIFVGADMLVLGTSSLAHLDTREAVEQATCLARNNRIAVLVDVNWQPMFWPRPAEAPGHIYDLLRQAQVLKVSKTEADWLFGASTATAIAHQFPHLSGVVVTDPALGCEYCFRSGTEVVTGKVLSFEVDVDDMNGAGEAFTAGLTHQLLSKGLCSLSDPNVAHEIVVYASAMSALATTRPGAIAALPTPREIDVFLYLNKDKCLKK